MRRLIAIVTALTLCCAAGIARCTEAADTEGTEVMDMENRQMFMEMIGQDTPNDRKSLSWDGTALTVVDDPLDDASLLDGRGGEYAAARLRTPLLRVIVREESGLLRDVPQGLPVCCDAAGQHFTKAAKESKPSCER